MRRIITITCTLMLCLATHAQRITASFQGTPLPDVLERLNILQHEYDICAINNELEEFIITADVKDATLHEALAQIVAYYPIRISTKGRTVYVEALSKQLVQYRGVVVGRDSVPLSYATVTLYNPIDTTLLRQAACSNAGVFVVPCPEDSVLARFTHVAYDTLWIKSSQSNLGVIQMHEHSSQIHTIEVAARQWRQIYSYKDMPLDQILDDISEQLTNYEFHIKGNGLHRYNVSYISFEEATLQHALERLSKSYPIKYSIEGNVVRIEELKNDLIKYRGTVVDSNKNPIASTTVTMFRARDSIPLRKTTTGEYGTYTLSCYEDSVLMVFYHPAYKSLCIKTTKSNVGITEMLGKNEEGAKKEADSSPSSGEPATPSPVDDAKPRYNGPEFPGGDEMLKQFISENTHYPIGIKSKKDFTAEVELLIKENGTPVLGRVKKPSNASDLIVREVKRLIKAMPTWESANEVLPDGRSIPQKSVVQVTIPFTRGHSLGTDITTIHIEKAGTLAQLLTQEQKDTCLSLAVSGPINSSDILTLRSMAGGDGGKGQLEYLDLSHAKIVTDMETPYLTLDMAADDVEVLVREREAVKDKTQFKAYTPTFMGTQNNIRHYNEYTPRLMAATDKSTPRYTIEHSPGWVGTYQKELRYMEEATHWETIVVLSTARLYLRKDLLAKGQDPSQADDVEINTNAQNFKWTRMQQRAMRKLKGQYVVQENGRYIYKSYTRDNKFCLDMFHDCLSLKKVLRPNNTRSNGNVIEPASPIKYY